MDTHVLEVPAGDDIIESITNYARRNQIGGSVLSALGMVGNLSLATTAQGAGRSFHGRYEILSVAGRFFPPHAEGSRISMSLVDERGAVVGGRVVALMALGHVKLILGSFNNIYWDEPGSTPATRPCGSLPNQPSGQLRPHVLVVPSGADIISRVTTYAHQNHIGVLVLNAHGMVENVSFARPRLIRHLPGRFEIVSLNWVFLPPDTGVSSIYISLVDERSNEAVGGRVVGQLMALRPVMLILGSYISGF